jgi:hypothetical protein
MTDAAMTPLTSGLFMIDDEAPQIGASWLQKLTTLTAVSSFADHDEITPSQQCSAATDQLVSPIQ